MKSLVCVLTIVMYEYVLQSTDSPSILDIPFQPSYLPNSWYICQFLSISSCDWKFNESPTHADKNNVRFSVVRFIISTSGENYAKGLLQLLRKRGQFFDN